MAEVVLAALLRQALLLGFAVGLLWMARPLLKRLGASAGYAAWLLVPAIMLTPALPRPAQEPLQVVMLATGAPTAAALPDLPAPAASTAALWLAPWLGGTLLVVAVQAGRQRRLARCGTRLPAGSSPALVGLLRPRIALPADFEQRFAPAERELILAHEQVHRERLDNLWNLLACALTALHWWNPLAWWAARRMRADQELACDAAVLASRPGAAADYTRALLAAHDLTPHGAPLASRWGTTHPLVERMTMLRHVRPMSVRKGLTLSTLLLGLAGAAYALQAAPAEPPVVEGFIQLRFDLRLAVDGTEVAKPRLISFPAKDSLIAFSDKAETRQWIVALNGQFAGDDQLMIDSTIRLNEDAASIRAWNSRQPTPRIDTLGSVVAKPRLLVKDGDTARVQATTPDGQHQIDFSIKVKSFRAASPVPVGSN